MAIVSTALTLVQDYVPYERPPQPQTLWTAIPRGLLTGIVNAGVVDAKPINDQQRLSLTMTLPGNFGYVMSECQLLVRVAGSPKWVTSYVHLTNFIRGASEQVQGLEAMYPQPLVRTEINGAAVAMQVIQPWPTMPMIASLPSAPIICVINATNLDAVATVAGTCHAFISFWQFDLEQIRKYPINSPQPVHSR